MNSSVKLSKAQKTALKTISETAHISPRSHRTVISLINLGMVKQNSPCVYEVTDTGKAQIS